jgi:hypothetical protein
MHAQEKAALVREVEELNATVFSKSFKAPSAWAEREVKYKAERRDWERREARLKEAAAKLEAENARYRADNKAAEFEARIQVRSRLFQIRHAPIQARIPWPPCPRCAFMCGGGWGRFQTRRAPVQAPQAPDGSSNLA